MYIVIFKATLNEIDAQYSDMASQLREIAQHDYGCTEFTSCTEGNEEIAISYWPSLEHIKAWHQNPLHQKAQKLGKEKWYASYQVDITKRL